MTPYLKLINATRHGWSALIYFIYFMMRYAVQIILNLPLSHRLLLFTLYSLVVFTFIIRMIYGRPVKYFQEYFGK
ncbi:hypothetical protein SAMD00019534_028360, partial [Acytostelium subglobosum LB1]|uniref:hypothetical protein n=1 Tax=Acytostelium subglobosum LB1 TaxID=1410327 RepID=UPI000644D8A3